MGEDPDRRRAKRFDIIQFLFDALEIAAVNGTAVGRVVIAIGIVVGGVPVEKAVGHDLINTLRLPEFVGRILGDSNCPQRSRARSSGKPWREDCHDRANVNIGLS
jgi:hypothetical protein